ncbi:MAG: type VI secretion system baseplate subunit TssE [Cellvibrio sp.]
MKSFDKKEIRPSILDRLIDLEPHIKIEPQISRHHYLRELRASVRRDIENLLNTRYRLLSAPDHFIELNQSLINYGLPDLSTINMMDLDKRQEFIKRLERTIGQYEPRFKSIRVNYVENKEHSDRSLRFRISATLYADPAPEVIVFDSILDPVFRTVKVKESHYG